MRVLLAIALGSALGGVARYLAGALVHAGVARTFPYGTMAVNVAGCALIGLAWVLLAARGEAGELPRAFLLVGVLGGFTTFSAFSLETLLLVEQQAFGKAAVYVAGSVAACIVATWAGMQLGRHWLA